MCVDRWREERRGAEREREKREKQAGSHYFILLEHYLTAVDSLHKKKQRAVGNPDNIKDEQDGEAGQQPHLYTSQGEPPQNVVY